MCEFAKYNENQVLICTHTNKRCTLCVMGNAKTYKEAKEAEKGENDG